MTRRFVLLLALAGCTPAQTTPTPEGDHSAPPVASTGGGMTIGAVPSGDTVATFGSHTISSGELDGMAAGAIAQAKQAEYEAKKQALDQKIAETLIDDEATARGMTKDALLEAEVTKKVLPPSEADIQQFYNENQQRIGAPIEVAHDQIAAYITQQAQQARYMQFIDELKQKTPVSINLEAPRFYAQVNPDDPREGSATAPIQIIEFSDFECPFCSMAEDTVTAVREKYGDKVAVTYKHFPLPRHSHAIPAAEAALCANEQGKFWEYHEVLFKNQHALDGASLSKYGGQIGLDQAKFDTCVSSRTYKDRVEADMKAGDAVGMNGTPGFYINGVMVSGAQPLPVFVEIIDRELAKTQN